MAPAWLMTALKGFAMGAADIVPGVSGGTIALVMGIYERLVRNVERGSKALGRLAKGNVGGFIGGMRSVEWSFLIPLGIGILVAVGLLSSIIEQQLHDRPETMAGLFFGLVLGSVVVALGEIQRWSTLMVVIGVVVTVAAFVLLGLQSAPTQDPPLLGYFVAGSIAICAMILPGISGSFLLLMMGMYAAVLGAVHDRNFAVLAVFMAGAVVGLALFSSLLGWLLDTYHGELLAGLIGLMLGSLRVLWPWPHGVGLLGDDETPPVSGTGLGWPEAGTFVAPIVLAIVAFVLVVAVSKLATSTKFEEVHPSVDDRG